MNHFLIFIGHFLVFINDFLIFVNAVFTIIRKQVIDTKNDLCILENDLYM